MHPPTPTDIDHGVTARLARSPLLGQGRRQQTAYIAHEGATSGRHRLTFGVAADAAAGHGPHVAGGDRLEPTLGGRYGDGVGKAMLRMAFQASGAPEHLLSPRALALDSHNKCSAPRGGARLFESG